MESEPFQEGEVILGKYRIEQVLGQGAMGVVLAARHIDLGELFAIKLMLPQALAAPSLIERFLQEARASARLKGIHVAKVHDVGRTEDGAPYMIMEHLSGSDLSSLLKKRGQLDAADVITYVLQACEAVAEAHSLGIVHRDIKPANLFLTHLPNGSPCVKVLDFGVSKQLIANDGPALHLTQAGSVLGSPLYMPPEQMTSRGVDPRSDIWALGVVIYELLTGTYPFSGTTLPELVAKVVQDEPLRPTQLRLDIPSAFDDIVLRCLQKKPENRFQTVKELMGALTALSAPYSEEDRRAAQSPSLVSVALQSTSPPLPSAPPPGTSSSGEPKMSSGTAIGSAVEMANSSAPAAPTEGAAPAKGSSPASRGLTVALLAALVLGGGALMMRERGRTGPAQPSVPASASASAPSPSNTTTATPATKASKKKWWEDITAEKTGQPSAKLPPPRLSWLTLQRRAVALEEAKKPEEARAVLVQALDVARAQLGQEDAAFLETLQELARLSAALGKLDDAEKYLREAMEVVTKHGDPTEEGFDDARKALVAVLVKQGKVEEAAKLRKDTDPPLPTPSASQAPSASSPPKAAPPPKPRDPFGAWDSH